MVSCLGLAFATLGAVCFAFAPERLWLFLAGAVLVQLRLVCNLIDGMVAVEGRRGGPTGVLFNELPDRYEDAVLLAGFAYAGGVLDWGLVAGVLAVGTAYLRAVGSSLGLGQDFRGPMAKPQRMALLTAGAVVAFAERLALGTLHSPRWIIALAIAGTVITCGRRIRRMAARLSVGT
jgi:phosphatidylglycerophosphate synthase